MQNCPIATNEIVENAIKHYHTNWVARTVGKNYLKAYQHRGHHHLIDEAGVRVQIVDVADR